MTDDIERAQEIEQRDRDNALRLQLERQARIKASFAPRVEGVEATCIDCDEAIEPERLKALSHKTSRCAQCARDHEHRLRGFR
ncbi:TraR/DksA C4-type zinc finger protein [Dyella sp. 2RAB6]|uniref:TraR/DksA C4-type zinc finger protein n=1 Tax=Dyella sp. 2RAB6 TaxID=3232992 RepID=UPI003F90673A